MTSNAKLSAQWNSVRAATAANQRSEFHKYCQLAIDGVREGRLGRDEAAYRICGLSALDLHHLVPSDRAIIDMACNLELPAGQQDKLSGDWEALLHAITENSTNNA